MSSGEEKKTRNEMEAQFRFTQEKLREKKLTERVLRYENLALRSHVEFLENELEKLRSKVKELQNGQTLPLLPDSEKKIRIARLQLREKFFSSDLQGAYKKWKFYSRHRTGHVFSENFRKYLLLRRWAEKLSPEGASGFKVPEDLPLTTLVVTAKNTPWEIICFLELLFTAPSRIPLEVLILSPGGDLSGTLLEKLYPGVRVIDSENTGELLSCAGGEFLLFARDTTPLLPECAAELAAALHTTPPADGAVPCFYHAFTGELLESGLNLCRNGEVIYHRNTEKTFLPSDDYFRECDSFARPCFIIKRKFFEENIPASTAVGALDSAFGGPLLEKGVKFYLAPLAGVLCTADETFPERADEKWMAQYGGVLAERRYGSREEYFNSPYGKAAVLYIDAEIPRGDRGSGGMDALFFMEYMIKRNYHVLFFGENTPSHVPGYTPILQRMGVECFTAGKSNFSKYLKSFGHLFETVFVSRVYQAQNFDYLIRKYLPQAGYIFNTVDVHFIREKREAELKNSQELSLRAFMTEKLELTLMARADAVILISSDEKRFLAEVYGMENCHHIPQARKIFGRKNPPEKRSGILFIGSAHNPNADALKYYVEELLPLLEKRNIDGSLTVIGEELHKEILQQKELAHVAACPHIHWAGFVEDPGELFEAARLTIAPLRYGAGTKGKVATSMAYGVPCVTTSYGSEGTGMRDGEHLLVRDNAGSFAEAMEQLMTDDDLWMKISAGGFDFLEKNYAVDKVEKQMDELWNAAKEHHQLHTLLWQTLRQGELPSGTDETSPPRLFEALRSIQHDRYGYVLCETERQEISKAEIISPHLKLSSNILQEEGRYDYVLFTSSFSGSVRDREALIYAAELLYDGGRIIMPLPGSRRVQEELLHFLFEEFSLQRVAFSPVYNVLCLTKELPGRGDSAGFFR